MTNDCWVQRVEPQRPNTVKQGCHPDRSAESSIVSCFRFGAKLLASLGMTGHFHAAGELAPDTCYCFQSKAPFFQM